MKKLGLVATFIALTTTAACSGSSSSSSAQPATFCGTYAAEIETIGNNGMVGKNNKDQAADALLAATKRLEKATPSELRVHVAKLTAYAQRNAEIRHRYATEIDTFQQRGVDPPAEWKSFMLAGGPTEDFQAVTDYADANCK